MRNRTTGNATLSVAAALALAGLVAIGSSLAAAQTVVIGSEGAIPPLDPHRTSGTVSLRVTDAVYDPLIREDLSQESSAAPALVPALAESWSVSEDGLTYTFKLREGVAFHDGAAFDAQALQTNFDRLMDESSPVFDDRASGNTGFLTRWIDSTNVVDDFTFTITLKEKFSGLPRLLTDRRLAIVSPQALEAHPGDALGFNPAGTGPFKTDSFEQGQQLVLSRNDDYWGETAGIEQLVFQTITDPTALAIAMQTGDVDVIPSASPQQIQQLSGQPGIQVQYPEPANAYYIQLNHRADPVTNKLLRQALNYAINREALTSIFNGQATPTYGPVPVGNEISSDATRGPYSYDPEKARALIAESGLATPIQLLFYSPNSGPGFGLAAQVMALIQQDLKAVGIDMSFQLLEHTALTAFESPGYAPDFHGVYSGWVTGANSAYWLERMFSASQVPPNGVNRGWFESAAVDAAFEEARSAPDEAAGIEAYRKAADIVADEGAFLFLYQDRLPRLFRDRLKGIEPARSVFLDYSRFSVTE